MIGKFQQSSLRIELGASKSAIGNALTKKELLRKWLPLNCLSSGIPDQLAPGVSFNTLSLGQKVESVSDNSLRLILSGAIDGYQEWYWGDGWVQSKLEGVSLLPISLAATANLLSLREFVKSLNSEVLT
jgi:hypothetical protein